MEGVAVECSTSSGSTDTYFSRKNFGRECAKELLAECFVSGEQWTVGGFLIVYLLTSCPYSSVYSVK